MEPIRLKINDVILEKMKKYYDSQMVKDDGDNYIFKAKVIGCEINVSDDLIVEFNGDNALNEAKIWSKKAAKIIETNVIASNNEGYFNQHHIGAAETGSQDYLGPICIVSCYVSENDIKFLRDLQIPPIHTLTNQQIINYAKEIKGNLIYSLLVLDNSHYNKMVSEGLNLASIKSKLFNQATVNVMQKIKQNVKIKVMNQFVSPRTYYNYLKNDVIVVKDITFETNAESQYYAVLAANILSQYAYLQYYTNMAKSLKMNLARGTSSSVDLIAAKIGLKYGDKILTKVAKLNFTNTKKVNALIEKSKN